MIKTILGLAELTTVSDRVVLIDPNDIEYPPCLNLFDFGLERLTRYKERYAGCFPAVEPPLEEMVSTRRIRSSKDLGGALPPADPADAQKRRTRRRQPRAIENCRWRRHEAGYLSDISITDAEIKLTDGSSRGGVRSGGCGLGDDVGQQLAFDFSDLVFEQEFSFL
jgi:hypothetical protein